ncbi:hypothetical protein PVL29_007293 [Vitis rotundifolia]|uniref:non-specific serine/threonine protein kinase n=2 Tax=Vitis rotundifolia TaxID=103349 RepID=A0AA39A1C6_VITRO|nr:hypothetical protein PVL29_007293 [Vitis rotundifolia]
MRLYWWQQLPLLILIQLLEPNRLSHKLYAEALLACKSTIGSPRHFSGRAGRYPCLRQWVFVDYHKLKDQGVVSLFSKAHPPSPQTRAINLSPFAPKLYLSHKSIQSQAKLHKTRNLRITAAVDGDSGVPTLTTLPPTNVNKPRKQRLAAIVGGIGAALLVVIIVVLVYICLMRVKKFIRRTSETASSVPSPPVEWDGRNTSLQASALSPYGTTHLRQLTILELEHATCNFSQNNIIGEGGFGLVYKGLLLDGSIVAIKRRLHTPTQFFAHEVKRIARVQHKHLVKLIGYCEENHQQLLVYDYLQNGNVGNHLYNSEGLPIGRLEIWQRLSIALGAAKGLEHLHSLVPSFLHMHFRTSNVLVDENFTAKVSDFGLSRLLAEGARAGSSSAIDWFLDPELRSSKNFSETSDVYSYGVFLLELISGREAHGRDEPNSQQNLVLHAKCINDLNNFADKTLGDHTMDAVKEMMELALACVDISVRRPTMKKVVEELERIQHREIGHQQAQLGEEIGVVTLGSELFK